MDEKEIHKEAEKIRKKEMGKSDISSILTPLS